MLKNALFWEPYMKDSVRCFLCMRKCIIDKGQWGWCQTRYNQDGQLITVTYGKVALSSISPIETKHMYNFFPGSLWLSLGGLGCNFQCHGCQSWGLSHCDVKEVVNKIHDLSPEIVVKKALRNGCKGIAFSHNEPTMWLEFVLDVFKLAKSEGLSTCLVTNGYLGSKAFDAIAEYTDGLCIDVKGSFMESYTRIAAVTDINTIFSNASDAKRKHAMHVEVVTNIIPGYNSSEKEIKEIASWMFAELGKDTPLHLTRFFPYGEFKDVVPTPVGLLEKSRLLAMKEGLNYVYIGNIPGHLSANTYCQKCKKIIIKRKEYDEVELNLKNGHCSNCKSLIFGRFSL
ncbi:MAG: AmmeMemoRadiSam system radical SAM enzyme [Candidatus Omnitrophica bacterium]|nr:AmmeMemoRadiSam system radical SAM enzyme [Candidatus Omnitrophota bacterium]